MMDEHNPLPADEPSDEEKKSARGRARERQQRRKQGRVSAQAAESASIPRPPRTLPGMSVPSRERRARRPDAGSLPHIRLPIDRVIFIAVGAVVFVALVVILLGRIRNQPTSSQPNAIFLGQQWTYQNVEDAAMRGFADRLRQHEVGVLFAWVGSLELDNTWLGADNFSAVAAFAPRIKTAYPEAQVYGWIRIPAVVQGVYRLNLPEVQAALVTISQQIVSDYGYDGVMIQIDPVFNGDSTYLALLRAVRAAVGANVRLIAAVPPDWTPLDAETPLPPQIAPGTVWDTSFKQSVALLVNDLVVMSFNSGMTSTQDYVAWMAYQTRQFALAAAELNAGTRIYMGMPTYEAEERHNPAVENISTAADGILVGLQRAGEQAAAFVRGTALYGEWTMNDAEWAEFRSKWAEAR